MSTGDLQQLTMAVGELKGQMRELIHLSNNNSQKIDGIGELVFKAQGLPGTIADIERRVADLEAKGHRSDGAWGIVQHLLKWPLVGWAVAVFGGIYAAIKGGVFK